ncbi:MAG: heavy metal translocating P-type ATPase, partial [Oscillospiraceae bacterium]|nr:heavy metal translocating P-type ATPase [Oscillospiraceae bacterium]
VGADTTLNQIIQMISDAAATKAPIAKTADRVSAIFVPVVISIAVLVTCVWLLVGEGFAFALARGISVLVISCPCALGLATPVAIMVGSGVGAKNGILFKTAVSLEQAGKTKLAALDKTGTVTTGAPTVTDLFPAEGVSEAELLTLAYSLEQKSEHPLARAVVSHCSALGIVPAELTEFRALPGNGLEAEQNGQQLLGGSVKYVAERLGLRAPAAGKTQTPAESPQNSAVALLARADELADAGKTPLLFARGKQLLGLIAVADVIKPESPAAVKALQEMGIRVILLTGDNRRTANAIAAQIGVDEVIAEVLPEGKEAVIRQLQARGPVLMVGDGVNDAPALTRAEIGIAIGAGTDVAVDAADVVLMKSRLTDVPAAIRLSRATLRNVRQNLFWAFLYNTIGIPLAAGAFIKAFGWTLNPMFGAAAMSLSSFCVVTNALRLNFVKLGTESGESAATEQSSEPIRIAVKGMMCHNCERHVREALEVLPGIRSAEADYSTGVVTLQGDASEAELKRAITAAGSKYKKQLSHPERQPAANLKKS